MREIKFRAWDKNINAMGMVYGFDFSIEEVSIMFPKLTKINGKVQKDSTGTQAFIDEVKLMQFTGLKDKNGKDIYEGDIIKVHDLEEDEEIRDEDFIGVFIYDKENLRFQFDEKYLGYIDEIGFIVTSNWLDYEYEVIGNIYENPELLKEIK